MLDQISRAIPPMLWLTQLKQTENPNEVLIEGKCITLSKLSDFVANLEASGYFKRSVEIVMSQTEPLAAPPGELVKFTMKAQFQPSPIAAAVALASAPAAGSGGR
jgi:Tfp pilus assembly protein PilN